MNTYCKSALHQIKVAVTTIVDDRKLAENDLQKRPTPNKHSIGELLEHIAIICEADSLISDGASQDKMNKFYSSVSYKSLKEMKEALIKSHQFLEDKFMNFTDFELQEEITSYWGVTYSRYEWLLEIVAHRETAYRYVNDKRLSSF
ncbi:DinB family protein [Peribacillus simplex]|uniref:DinB family protein n=1 Tax=Peribacillus simplex TaxID=1478 RepID=A0A9X9EQV8_9BACI|nr:DinB family protein [Peribacillus simplex]TKH07701.1 DinB family protein [Peribacillus simplex]